MARKAAYTSKNIKSAFETTGIVPFIARKVLDRYTDTAAADPKSLKASIVTDPGITLPTTPGNIRAIRHLRQQVLSPIDNSVARIFIEKLTNAAVGGLAEGYLGQERALQLEAAMASKAEESNNRRRTKLTNSRAVLGKDLLVQQLATQNPTAGSDSNQV